MQFLYEALNITTTCESGYRASINQRLHIEFALMKLSFLAQKGLSAPPSTAPEQSSMQKISRPQTPAIETPPARTQVPEERKEQSRTEVSVAEDGNQPAAPKKKAGQDNCINFLIHQINDVRK